MDLRIKTEARFEVLAKVVQVSPVERGKKLLSTSVTIYQYTRRQIPI
jgi:hypothetical protein